ncbi:MULTISPECIES: plasmid IncI1-type surface exclusion protein ExcA [Yersinia]|uniref:Exclusion-determining protein n=2 Tax=Yersinia TaxID=629 RepID=B7UF05_YERPU|nr:MULTISPECIES: plasmid IncI1-type surface exclusion protein ExcA [Yersinia]MBO1551392.1 plasmid IncI1-type surface exclusion protein ExcA [Yersinia pseudotuberculosis]MBO1562468.1 plasmid IncI1-type surface exclusion protein ExcA [Yersinia pseudotuberculosis]MBO1571445.1 plasmid IncI1-type surface exclusion protein ExcA [Yersinia pseudotuberculosis]MBO1586397.1 plasmid IncI1-type surface exclusion protein ExcA [Yersinia pseudotuberculosis]MBO1631777.1 plasmid IncI1-type surface exclusion pro
MARHTTKKETILGVSIMFYIIAGIPIFLFIASFSTWMASDIYSPNRNRDLLYAALSWSALIIPIGWYIIRYFNKRRRLTSILSTIKSDESYDPTPENEIREIHSSAYFGIDTKRGTMLYVRLLNNKEVDILGFNISNWRQCELRANNQLRLYINSTEMPFIDIQNSKAWLLYEKICVMRNQQYNYPYNFPGYVKHNTERLANEMGFKMLAC